MPRPAHTDEQKREIRNRLRRAAAKLLVREGGRNITARSIAAEAGVSTGTLYSYFDSVSDVIESLWREPYQALVDQLTQISWEIDCPRSRLEAFMSAYIQFACDKAALFRNGFLYVRPDSLPPPTQTPLTRDPIFQLYRSTIREGQSAGLFRQGNLDELTQAFISAVHGGLAMPINFQRLALDNTERVPTMIVDAMLSWLEDTKS